MAETGPRHNELSYTSPGIPAGTIDRRTKALRYVRTVATVLAVAPILVGIGVLIGYAARIALLVQLRSNLPPMYPNTAVGFVIAGLSVMSYLWCSNKAARRICTAGAVLLILLFGTHMVEHLLRSGPTIVNEALMPSNPVVKATTTVPNRPVVETCLAMLLLAVALYRLPRPSRHGTGGQLAATMAALIGLTALVGYLYGVDRTQLGQSSVPAIGMALHTGANIFSLGVATLLCRPLSGWIGLATREGAAGSLSRRMLLVAAAVPLVLTGTLAVVSDVFVDNTELALSVVAILQIAVLAAVLLNPVQALTRFDRERTNALEEADRSRRALHEQAPLMTALQRELAYLPTSTDPRVTLACHAEPAEGVLTGDWFDLVAVTGHPDRIRLVLLDVSGHGAPSAMFALRLHDALLISLARGTPLADALSELEILFRNLNFIATAIVIEIDLAARVLTWANAGHPPALCLESASVVTLDGTGPLIGLQGAKWQQRQVPFPQGAVLLAYTDGLTEARNNQGEFFGQARLIKTASRWVREGAGGTVAAVVSEAKRHTGGRFDDDATIVAIEVGEPDSRPVDTTQSVQPVPG